MVKRNVVKIDEEKCNGCGVCISACAEGAIKLIDGKARLISDTYCDGLGACLGHCPQDAITIEQREADEFDEEATAAHLKSQKKTAASSGFVCPGMMQKDLRGADSAAKRTGDISSRLLQWPVQLKLLSPLAPILQGADLLLTADCVPFAMGDFHGRLLKGRAIAVGCPKLDDTEYYIEKLTEILKTAGLKSLTVIHMEVPCCSGLLHIAREAVSRSGADVPFEEITISLGGEVL